MALTLAIVAAICFGIVKSISTYNTKVLIDPPAVRGFKGDELSANIVLIFKRARWIAVNPSLIQAPFGLEAKSEPKGNNVTRISMKSKYAGRLSGLTIRIEITDVLNLFSNRIETIQANFVFDSLPLSILYPIPHTRPVPLALGERSGMSSGSSLELYALKDYVPFSETKDILWKRVAGMPDERLIVRVRDSSIPKVIRIGFLEKAKRDRSQELNFMDLACEGAGMIANMLIAAGCELDVIHCSNESPTIAVNEVKDFSQLADALMSVSNAPNSSPQLEDFSEVLQKADIVICGMRELEDQVLSSVISRKPTLAVAEAKSSPLVVGEQTLIYTGIEDVRKLVSRVLEK